TRELHLLALDPLSGGLGVRRHDIGVGRRGRGTAPSVLARHRRHGLPRPRPSGVRGTPRACDAVHAEWRRRGGVDVAMASDQNFVSPQMKLARAPENLSGALASSGCGGWI